MRKVLLALCIAGLLQSAASATLVGSWAETQATNAGTTYDVWTLTVTPTAGEQVYGFDVAAYDTAAGAAVSDGAGGVDYQDNANWTETGNAFQTGAKQPWNTTFLVAKPGVTVTYGVDSSDLYLAGSVTTGIPYASAFALLHVSVPHNSDIYTLAANNSLNGVSLMDSDEGVLGGNYTTPECFCGLGATATPIVFASPEPGTFALLGCGLFGLLAYAWRKRK